jgi:CheY-like chemotaxis protein
VAQDFLTKILVVDDDRLICWALQREFASLNIITRAVETATDALAELQKDSYDLAFLAIPLPDGNGIKLLEEIGRISPKVKITVMSSDASEANRVRAYAGGALQFLEKPFDLSEIHRILNSTLGKDVHHRKHPRHVCRIPLRISIVEPSLGEDQYDLNNLIGTAVEFGFGGLRIHTEYPLRVGQRIRARADSINDRFRRFVPPESCAEVVWVDPAQDGIVAGLRFVN